MPTSRKSLMALQHKDGHVVPERYGLWKGEMLLVEKLTLEL